MERNFFHVWRPNVIAERMRARRGERERKREWIGFHKCRVMYVVGGESYCCVSGPGI